VSIADPFFIEMFIVIGSVHRQTGSTGIVLGYCKDDEIQVNATVAPTTRLPLPKFRN
jgi:hypothetical protein